MDFFRRIHHPKVEIATGVDCKMPADEWRLILTSLCSIFNAMRYLCFGLATFLILFAMADIALSGACCNEDTVDPCEEDATCFCCCGHVTIEHSVELAADMANRPVTASYSPSETFSFPITIYHPPRSW